MARHSRRDASDLDQAESALIRAQSAIWEAARKVDSSIAPEREFTAINMRLARIIDRVAARIRPRPITLAAVKKIARRSSGRTYR